MNLNVGDDVLVNIPLAERKTQPEIAQYHGQKMAISKRIIVSKYGLAYYELEGAKKQARNTVFIFKRMVNGNMM